MRSTPSITPPCTRPSGPPPGATGRVGSRTHVAATQVKILVPGNHLMAALLGQRDELLRLVEGAFDDVRIAVRGNEIFFQAEDAMRVASVTGVQTCPLPI